MTTRRRFKRAIIRPLQLNFGLGKISVGSGLAEKTGSNKMVSLVSFKNMNKRYKVGSTVRDCHKYNPFVVLTFKNKKSVEVVIKALEKARDFLKN